MTTNTNTTAPGAYDDDVLVSITTDGCGNIIIREGGARGDVLGVVNTGSDEVPPGDALDSIARIVRDHFNNA